VELKTLEWKKSHAIYKTRKHEAHRHGASNSGGHEGGRWDPGGVPGGKMSEAGDPYSECRIGLIQSPFNEDRHTERNRTFVSKTRLGNVPEN